VNVPVGAVTLAFGVLRLRNHAEPRRRPFDLAGFLLAGGGLGCVTFALSEGPADQLGSFFLAPALAPTVDGATGTCVSPDPPLGW